MLPFWTSALVKSFGWLVLLARYGVVARVLGVLSPDGQAPELLHGRGAVLMGMTHALLPLAVLTMLPVMIRIDRGLLSAAATLGAPRTQTFWRVFFHLSMPGVAAAGLLVFIASLGFFILVPQIHGSGTDRGDGDSPSEMGVPFQAGWRARRAISSLSRKCSTASRTCSRA